MTDNPKRVKQREFGLVVGNKPSGTETGSVSTSPNDIPTTNIEATGMGSRIGAVSLYPKNILQQQLNDVQQCPLYSPVGDEE